MGNRRADEFERGAARARQRISLIWDAVLAITVATLTVGAVELIVTFARPVVAVP
jgi:hypothetical protein